MNQIKCGDCKHFAEQIRPKRSKRGGQIQLKTGHCLARTVYASNRPTKGVYPPRAMVKELPHGRHQIHIVRSQDVRAHCTYAALKE